MSHPFPARASLLLFLSFAPPSAADTISSFLFYDVVIDKHLDDGCHYDAHITGTLTPVYSRADWDQPMEAFFDISASLFCPHLAPVRTKEHIAHAGPMTRERAEAVLAQYATLTRVESERTCRYIPTFQFRGDNLICVGIEARCIRASR
jgi:hypothetical protein